MMKDVELLRGVIIIFNDEIFANSHFNHIVIYWLKKHNVTYLKILVSLFKCVKMLLKKIIAIMCFFFLFLLSQSEPFLTLFFFS